MEWIGAHTSPTGTPGEFGIVGLATGTDVNEWLLTPGEAEEFFDEPTLVRTLIWPYVGLLNSPAFTAIVGAGWMGIMVAPGGGAVPDPSINANRADIDWLWWVPFCLGNTGNADTIVSTFVASGTAGNQYDIRSKRKIPSGYGLAFYMSTGLINNVPLGLAIQARMLFANK